MEKLKNIEELIERKKNFLLKLQEKEQNKNIVNLLKSEINILSDLIEEIKTDFLDYNNQILKLENELKKLESFKLKLECICFIHGIDNLRILMLRPEQSLIQQFKETRIQNFRFYPIAFFEFPI